jgi:hypothetical protein
MGLGNSPFILDKKSIKDKDLTPFIGPLDAFLRWVLMLAQRMAKIRGHMLTPATRQRT